MKHYHFVTSSDRFPVPVRWSVKSYLTARCNQNLYNHALNASTKELGRLFQILTTCAEKKNIIGYFENFAVMSPRKRLCFRVVFEIMTKVVKRAPRQFFFVS